MKSQNSSINPRKIYSQASLSYYNKKETEGALPESALLRYQNQIKTQPKKRPVSLNIDSRMLNIILENKIQTYIQKIIHHNQVFFIPKMHRALNIQRTINMINYIDGLKDKNHMIIPIDEEKAFGKILHSFIIKVLENVRLEGLCLNIIKAIYEKPAGNLGSVSLM